MTIVDVHGYLDPNGEFLYSIAGVDDIRYDRIHFTPQGADVVAGWLSPKILRVAHQGDQLSATANASIGARPRTS